MTHKCINCGLVLAAMDDLLIGHTEDDRQIEIEAENFGLHTIGKLHTRLTPGDTVPSGECPECSCFMYPVNE